jgi:hypothetical protein
VVCAVNIAGEPLALEGEVLLASERLDRVLPPGAAAWARAESRVARTSQPLP